MFATLLATTSFIPAEKINETFLKNHTSEVLQIIKDICHNLPCPHCRHHAAVYMRSINVKHINSREKIKDMFFTFHNAVNKRLKKRSNFNLKIFKKLKKLQLPLETKKKKSNFIIKNNFKSMFVKKNVKIIKNKILKNERSSS